ncbi:hypothetical protein G7046_g1594 [Stylonectria norvegica]|nr:hypothetical protein G7046_g1594 [Stylonectria norvegica]
MLVRPSRLTDVHLCSLFPPSLPMSTGAPYLGIKDKDVSWFDTNPQIRPEARELLENYAGIPAQDVDEHVLSIVNTLLARFINGDMLDRHNAELNALDGSFDTIHIGMVLQLFNLEEQTQFLSATVDKLKRDSGGVVVGHTLGHVDAVEAPGAYKKPSMLHNWESWMAMWREVERRTGREVDVRGSFDVFVGFGHKRGNEDWKDDDWRSIVFEVWMK